MRFGFVSMLCFTANMLASSIIVWYGHVIISIEFEPDADEDAIDDSHLGLPINRVRPTRPEKKATLYATHKKSCTLEDNIGNCPLLYVLWVFSSLSTPSFFSFLLFSCYRYSYFYHFYYFRNRYCISVFSHLFVCLPIHAYDRHFFNGCFETSIPLLLYRFLFRFCLYVFVSYSLLLLLLVIIELSRSRSPIIGIGNSGSR